MSFASAQIAIESRFNTNFTDCDIKWQNVHYTPIAGTSFAEIFVLDATNLRADIGTTNKLHRTTGVISINVHTGKNIGTVTGRALADTIAAVFRDASFSGITCRSPLVRNIGEVEDWFIVNMSCEFYRDEVHA